MYLPPRVRARIAPLLQAGATILARLHQMTRDRRLPRKLAGALAQGLRRGGLRLKLVGLITLTIFFTVGTLSYLFANLMERSITEKAFEVVHTSIERIADLSHTALLERSPESRVNLDEVLRGTRGSVITGLLDVAVYATEKRGEEMDLLYFTGFNQAEPPLDGDLTRRLLVPHSDAVSFEPYSFPGADGKAVEAYRFFKPILFEYQGRTHLLGGVVLSYSQEAIFGPIRSVLRIAAATTAFVLLAGILLAYALGRRLSRPIITVAHAAGEVARGNLEVRLDIATNDEIQDLGNEFNRMVQGLREREAMKRFVSGSTLDMIRSGGHEEVQLGGKYETLTFLFSDARDFTAMSERIPPQELVAVINFYLALQTGIIRRFGGDIDKFVGDEVMAVFSGPENIERAITAAVEIQRAVGESNRERAGQGLPVLEVGIGINHGKVVVGSIGAYDRMDFTSIGSAVNLASRLCSEARASQVLIEKGAYQLTRQEHPVEAMAPLTVKGFSQPVEVVQIKR